MEFLKGNLLIGQSGGPTPVINASLAGVIKHAHKQSNITGIFGLVHGIEGALKEELIDLGQETPETIDLLTQTPASALGSCRHKLKDEEYDRILQVCRAHNIRHFVYIGGNDSMDTCHRISKLASDVNYEMQVMGVPKTVDNDLAYTDHTPGFGSAARFVALATRDTGRDLEAMSTFEDVSILETMGRNAGWLTAAAVLGKIQEDEAPNLIYVPEIAFSEDRFLADISRIHAVLGRVFVVVCEGIRHEDGTLVGQQALGTGGGDAFGHALPTLTAGVASYLSQLVNNRLQLRSRFLRPVLVGRGFTATVSEVDRWEAFMVGQKAVAALSEGKSGYMVTIERISSSPYQSETGLIELEKVANEEKLLPPEFINSDGNNITQEYVSYALPLINGPLTPLARLKAIRLEQKL
jgi:6-phosphofructokinase 1